MTYKNVLFRRQSTFLWYGVLLVIYAIMTLAFPPLQSTEHLLHINAVTYRLLVFLLELPYAIIWFLAFFAYKRLHEYSDKIHDSREGSAFKTLARAVTVMAWGLAVQGIVGAILNQIAAFHPGFQAASTIIGDYITLIVAILTFSLVSGGTRRLNDILHIRPNLHGTHLLILAGVALGVLFCYLTLSAWYIHHNPYHLSLFFTLFTMIVPYLYAWFVGLFAVYELTIYSRHAKGVFYRQALIALAGGIVMIVIGSIFVQYISVAIAGRTSFTVSFALVILYLLLIIEAIGFILIAYGAQRLKRIEDI